MTLWLQCCVAYLCQKLLLIYSTRTEQNECFLTISQSSGLNQGADTDAQKDTMILVKHYLLNQCHN